MRHRGLPAAFALATVLSVVSAGTTTATAATGTDRFRVVEGMSLVDTIDAPKSASGKLAQTDPSLLGESSSAPINVLVKLDYDPIASIRAVSRASGPRAPR